LRHYVQMGLPRPEAFPEVAAPLIVGIMPPGWVHATLKSGRALVLVDGVDEVPASQREEVHTWLNDLVATYPQVRFIVTSRPHAIPEGWMNHQAFKAVELQPLELPDIAAFIDHWHAAVRDEIQTDEEKHELEPLANHLKEQVRQNRAIHTLATSPLLCAMLCALHRERRRHLPVNRVELYRACCALLLERRDKESRIVLIDYPALTLGQKERILQDLAYWMLQANLSEADIGQVDERFSAQLVHMPNLPQDVTYTTVRRLLVERAGIIREPVAGQIDFTHRTFEEFFAAQAALDAGDIEKLVASALDDQWREVIILAAGLASKTLCEQLITGLIRRGDEEKEHQHQLHLLAVSCLETAIQLSPEVKSEVDKRLGQLVPPKNMAAAKVVAAAGELAVKYLLKKGNPPATMCAASIRALAMIGGEAALDMLASYAIDERETVFKELVRARNFFDRAMFAERIWVRRWQKIDSLVLDASLLDDLRYIPTLPNLTQLSLFGCWRLTDLDFAPLAHLSSLMQLTLIQCEQLTDLAPLAHLSNLTQLDLSGCSQLTDLTPLAGFHNLRIVGK
jgi:NACHT domain